MYFFFFDASGLAKRYTPEAGSPNVKFLFENVPWNRLICLAIGAAEVFSVCVRKRNDARISEAEFEEATRRLDAEVMRDDSGFQTLLTDKLLIWESTGLTERHAINSVDALVLSSAIQLATSLREQDNALVLIASDDRLLRAARREGLLCFDPENDSQAVLQDWVAQH